MRFHMSDPDFNGTTMCHRNATLVTDDTGAVTCKNCLKELERRKMLDEVELQAEREWEEEERRCFLAEVEDQLTGEYDFITREDILEMLDRVAVRKVMAA